MRVGAEAERRRPVTIFINGTPLQAYAGETVAGALLADGRRAWHRTRNLREPRGLFCGIGICFDCMVTVDGRPHVRACMTAVEDGMAVETQFEGHPIGPE